jgi:hypothetical protein
MAIGIGGATCIELLLRCRLVPAMRRPGTGLPPTEERLHTLRHISERLQRSVRDLQRDKPDRPAIYRFGQSIRVAEADLQRYLAAHRCEPKK